MEVPRSKSSLQSVAGQPDKKPSVHYPSDSQLLQIVPPLGTRALFSAEISSHTSLGAAGAVESARGGLGGGGSAHGGGAGGGWSGDGAGGGQGNGSANRKGRVGSLRDQAAIDLENLSDDLTPSSEPLQNRLDFSVVFGPFQPKYENEDFSDDPDGPNEGQNGTKNHKNKARAPELPITLFAFRLALIEKAASGLGTIAFLWATVVILGGFASLVGLTDFWVVTLIILAETSRIFSRSHELEWKHLSSRSTGIKGFSRIFSRWTRSLSGQSDNVESKHGRGSLQTSVHVKRARSVPGRFFGDRSRRSPDSNESDLRTPTNSSSASARHNARHGAAVLPMSAPGIMNPPPRSLELQKRTWSYLAVPLVPFGSGLLTTKLVSRVLYYAQIASASLSIGLSLWRLIDQHYYDPTEDPTESNPSPAPTESNSSASPNLNLIVSMDVFYVLAVLEAGLFLLEKIYWEYVIRVEKILDKVCEEDYVGKDNSALVEDFFYDVYDGCLKGSVFDGLDMDLVQYSISWIQKEVYNQQLGGAKLLNRFVSKKDKFRTNDKYAADALRRLGTTPGIIERLVEMLSWGSRHEEELLREISTIICRLVVYNRNCARFVAVPGAMDGVVALLLPHDTTSSTPPVRGTSPNSSPYFLRLIGLRILKYLCKDHKNSLKIGETRGLLSILMVFIEIKGKSSFRSHFEIDGTVLKCNLKTYKKTLQVLLLLASATNTSGKTLRNRIAMIVSGLKNLRDMIEFGTDQPELQRLAIEVIYHLAMEDDVRKMIGATGGLIRNLIDLYKDYRLVEDAPNEGNESSKEKKIREEKKLASVKAGEALARLVLQNEKNSKRLLELKDENNEGILVPVMVDALSNREDKIATSAASILRSVVKFADEDSKEEIATKTAPLVVRQIFFRKGPSTKSEMYEASLGLASRTVQPLDSTKYWEIFKTVNKVEFVQQLARNLQHTPTTNKYPRIRRFSVELIIALIEKDDSFLDAFKRHNLDLRSVLEKTADSTSEVENFCLFSGLVGYTRYHDEIEDLVERAIAAVDNYHRRSTSSEEISK
ncbi:unnamed protein product [Calypogeia fissa]